MQVKRWPLSFVVRRQASRLAPFVLLLIHRSIAQSATPPAPNTKKPPPVSGRRLFFF
jgi:hypothetical protein